MANAYKEAAGLTEEEIKQTFESYKPFDEDTTIRLKTCKEFDPYGDRPWLFMLGRCGSGKDHLASAIVNRAIESNFKTKYLLKVPDIKRIKVLACNLFALMSNYRYCAYQLEIGESKAMQDIVKNDIILMRDAIVKAPTEAGREFLVELFDRLYRERKCVIITSNILPQTFSENFDQRILSRLKQLGFQPTHESKTVPFINSFNSDDYRERI